MAPGGWQQDVRGVLLIIDQFRVKLADYWRIEP
jgi:hypothetical protein